MRFAIEPLSKSVKVGVWVEDEVRRTLRGKMRCSSGWKGGFSGARWAARNRIGEVEVGG
jgi:hypothetical protein